MKARLNSYLNMSVRIIPALLWINDMTDDRRNGNVVMMADVAVLKSQQTETNRRLDGMDRRFDSVDDKLDEVVRVVNENRGREKQDIAFWGKVAGLSAILGGISVWIEKHI